MTTRSRPSRTSPSTSCLFHGRWLLSSHTASSHILLSPRLGGVVASRSIFFVFFFFPSLPPSPPFLAPLPSDPCLSLLTRVCRDHGHDQELRQHCAGLEEPIRKKALAMSRTRVQPWESQVAGSPAKLPPRHGGGTWTWARTRTRTLTIQRPDPSCLAGPVTFPMSCSVAICRVTAHHAASCAVLFCYKSHAIVETARQIYHARGPHAVPDPDPAPDSASSTQCHPFPFRRVAPEHRRRRVVSPSHFNRQPRCGSQSEAPVCHSDVSPRHSLSSASDISRNGQP